MAFFYPESNSEARGAVRLSAGGWSWPFCPAQRSPGLFDFAPIFVIVFGAQLPDVIWKSVAGLHLGPLSCTMGDVLGIEPRLS